MSDFLDVLARDANETIDSGYYETLKPTERVRISLRKAILESKATPVITEIKAASPSAGIIRTNVKASMIAKAMAKGGATAISVLTEPKHFNGSLDALTQARRAVKLPILMKDIPGDRNDTLIRRDTARHVPTFITFSPSISNI